MADDTKILVRGETEIQARDTSPGALTIDATDTVVTTTSRSFQRISTACPTQDQFEAEPPLGTSTLNSRQFFAVRDQVTSFLPDPAGHEILTPRVSSFTELETLPPVFVGGDISITANRSLLGVGADLPVLFNGEFSSFQGIQDTLSSQATLEDTAFLFGNKGLEFDGGDFYTILASDLLSVLKSEEDFVIEVIVSLDSVAGDQTLFSQYVSAAGNGSFLLHYNSGFKVELISDGVLGDVTLTSAAAVIDRSYHLMVERVDLTFNLYLDGVIVDTVTEVSSRALGDFGALVGARDTGGVSFDGTPGNFFEGVIGRLNIQGEVAPEDLFNDYALTYSTGIEIVAKLEFTEAFYDARVCPHVTNASNVRIFPDLTGKSSTIQPSTSTAFRPTYTEDVLNGHPALTFDGSNDVFRLLEPVAKIAEARGAFTITTLVRPRNTNTTYFISFNTFNGGNRVLFGYNGSSQRWLLFDGISVTLFTSIEVAPRNVFYIVTARFNPDTETYEMFVDGELVLSEVFSGTVVQSDDQYILGAELDFTTVSDVLLGEVCFHAIASTNQPSYRTLFEAYALGAFLLPEDLPNAVAVYRSDDTGTVYANTDPVTSVQDLSGSVNTATQGTGGEEPLFITDVKNGFPALRFDGANDSLEIGTLFSNSAVTDLTVSAYASNTSGTSGSLLTTKENVGEGYTVGYDASNLLAYDHEGETPVVTSEFGLASEESLALRRSALLASIQKNGKLPEDTSITGYTASTDVVTRIGGSTTSPFFEGDLFEMAVYDRALQDYEVWGLSFRHRIKYGDFLVPKPVISGTVFEFDVLDLTPVADNTALATIPDQSLVSSDAALVTGTGAVYRSNLVAGQPTLYFGGDSNYNTGAITHPTGNAAFTMIMVASPWIEGSGGNLYVADLGDGTVGQSVLFGADFADATPDWRTTKNTVDITNFATSQRHLEVVCITYDGAGTFASYTNGIQRQSVAQTYSTTSGSLTLGGLNANTQFWYGWVSYYLLTSDVMSQEEVQAMTKYLHKRFRLPL